MSLHTSSLLVNLSISSLSVCVWMQRGVLRAQMDTLDWLKARLAVLEDLSADAEAITQRTALDDFSSKLSALLASLEEVRVFCVYKPPMLVLIHKLE